MNGLKALPQNAAITLALILAVALMAAGLTTALTVRAQGEPWRAAVTGLTVTAGEDSGDLEITWDAHPESPEEYRVVWALDGGASRPSTKLTGMLTQPPTITLCRA